MALYLSWMCGRAGDGSEVDLLSLVHSSMLDGSESVQGIGGLLVASSPRGGWIGCGRGVKSFLFSTPRAKDVVMALCCEG
jgi:hypothetical protein